MPTPFGVSTLAALALALHRESTGTRRRATCAGGSELDERIARDLWPDFTEPSARRLDTTPPFHLLPSQSWLLGGPAHAMPAASKTKNQGPSIGPWFSVILE
jgi:hypothetical protein